MYCSVLGAWLYKFKVIFAQANYVWQLLRLGALKKKPGYTIPAIYNCVLSNAAKHAALGILRGGPHNGEEESQGEASPMVTEETSVHRGRKRTAPTPERRPKARKVPRRAACPSAPGISRNPSDSSESASG